MENRLLFFLTLTMFSLVFNNMALNGSNDGLHVTKINYRVTAFLGIINTIRSTRDQYGPIIINGRLVVERSIATRSILDFIAFTN